MKVKRVPAASSSILDVLERVLDRGIVIDAWVGVSVAGIRVLELDTRIVVASLDTYLSRGQDLSIVATATRPALRLAAPTAPATAARDADPAFAVLPSRRRPRRRKLSEPPRTATRPTPLLRCENGCTFEGTNSDGPPTSMACPYRKRVRCRIIAS
jgi:gas vesicle structural protein